MLGYDADDPFPTDVDEWVKRFVLPADAPRLRVLSDAALHGGAASYAAEFRLRHRDGNYRWVLARASIRRDATGKPVRVVGFHIDITQRHESEDALRVSNERYRLVSLASNDAIWDWDIGSGQVQRSEGFGRLFGYHPAEVGADAQWWTERIHPDDRERVLNELGALMETGADRGVSEYRFRKADGSYAFVTDRACVLYDSYGRVARVIGAMIDLTERYHAEEKLRHQSRITQTIADNATSCLFLLDEHGRPTFMNRAAEASTGYTLDELRNSAAACEVFSRLVGTASGPDVTSEAPGAMLSRETVFRRRDGTHFPAAYAVTPFERDGVRTGAVLELRDVSHEHEARQRLYQHAEQLARSNAELERFAFVASHDLKEPLRTITNFAQLLKRKLEGRVDPQIDRDIGFITDSTKRMYALINDLLEYSRAGRTDVPMRRTDLNEVMSIVLGNLRETVRESGAEVIVGSLPCVLADGTQLVQLLQNLVSNAIKYRSQQPPRIVVDAKREGGNYHFTVEDNGIGIDPRFSDRIFELFQRLHGRNEYSGTGIGLSICKRIVQRHGGRIWVEPGPRGGSLFHFTLHDHLKQQDSEVRLPRVNRPHAGGSTELHL